MFKRIFLLAAAIVPGIPALAQQASITLLNSDVAYCYKQDASWNLTKSNDSGYPTPVQSPANVKWTINATKTPPAPGSTQLCAIGFVSIKNTGTAPATIGNIVVDLQRNLGGGSHWAEVSADVANATSGDAATSAKIVGAALQTQTTYPDVVSSAQAATFTENALSGSLGFTDADSNTIFALTPKKTIPVGNTVNLFFTAVFNTGSIAPALTVGEQLRTEVFVSFGNAGLRRGLEASSAASRLPSGGPVPYPQLAAAIRAVLSE